MESSLDLVKRNIPTMMRKNASLHTSGRDSAHESQLVRVISMRTVFVPRCQWYLRFTTRLSASAFSFAPSGQYPFGAHDRPDNRTSKSAALPLSPSFEVSHSPTLVVRNGFVNMHLPSKRHFPNHTQSRVLHSPTRRLDSERGRKSAPPAIPSEVPC